MRVYTHRATADATQAKASSRAHRSSVMQNGVSPIVRLRFANGQELRCTPNHRIWTLNRGYVAAAALTPADQVLLNDSPTPAEDASWVLPVRGRRASRHRAPASGGAGRVPSSLPERWSEGLGELMGHLVGDGWITDVQTGWVYGGDDIDDGLARFARGAAPRADRRRSRRSGDEERHGAASRGQRGRAHVLPPARRQHRSRAPRSASRTSVFTAPTEVQAAFLRGLFGADGCVIARERRQVESVRRTGQHAASVSSRTFSGY